MTNQPPKTVAEILNKLIGHDDSIEFGDGYHDECKKETDEALRKLSTLLEEIVSNDEQLEWPEGSHWSKGEYAADIPRRIRNELRDFQRQRARERGFKL